MLSVCAITINEVDFVIVTDPKKFVFLISSLNYDLQVGREGETFKDVQQRALAKFYKRPLAIPDERMLVEPIWSTWATYGGEVNQSAVLTVAHRIVKEGFSSSSHIEIDDIWEICYGDHAFGPKFPDPPYVNSVFIEYVALYCMKTVFRPLAP